MKKIKLFKLGNQLYKRYKTEIKNNEDNTYIEARKKLYRNFILGRSINRYGNCEIRAYGNLMIIVNLKTWKIVDIYNEKEKRYRAEINYREKQDLNKLLRIGVLYI